MQGYTWPVREAEERWLVTAWATALMLVLAGPAGLSPDGLEMLRMAAGLPGGDEVFWLPLWPMLMMPVGLFPDPIEASRIVNLLLAGAVAWPLHLMSCRLSGRAAARMAVVIWALLPAVVDHGAVLDARPLGWLFCALAVALAMDAGAGRRPWWPVWLAAGLAILARPEAMILWPLLGVGSLLVGLGPGRMALGLALAAIPRALWAMALGSGRAWEPFRAAWVDTWGKSDLTALYGAASAGTGYRRFVNAAVDAGVETSSWKVDVLLGDVSAGLVTVARGLVEGFGFLGLLALIFGLVLVGRRGRVAATCVAMGFLPLVAIALLPQARDQPTAAANLMFLVAPGLAVVAVSLEHVGRRVGKTTLPLVLAVVFVLLEAHASPLRVRAPAFVEQGSAATAMVAFLEANPPANGTIVSSSSSRGVVLRAGLRHVPLPSPWEPWTPAQSSGVLVDIPGQDGGRAMEIMENPDWSVLWAVADDGPVLWESAQGGHFGQAQAGMMLVYLERRTQVP